MKTELREKLVSLEAGDPVSYGLLEELEKSDVNVETKNYYSDSAGFLEGWRIGEKAEIVVNCLYSGEPTVRKVQNVEEELSDVEVIVADRRHFDNEAGAFEINIDSDKLRVRSGGGRHSILLFREKEAEELYNRLNVVFGDDNE